MFKKMMDAIKSMMDNGNGGYEWNSDAESFYDAMWKMACAGVISGKEWNELNDFVKDYIK